MTSTSDTCHCGGQPSDELGGLCPRCLLGAALDHAPTQLGDYEIGDRLGSGGMGAIYRARDRTLRRDVALKVILGGELATLEQRQRFHAETRAAAALDHPHIVPIYEVGEHEGRLYYTMKEYRGALADHLELYRAPASAAELVATVARAVHYGHERGVLHRDLKPGNILLDEQGRPHVGDFGAAKRLGEPGMTGTGSLIGTLPYMAPEARAGGQSTIAVDVYSLGIVLFELLTGVLPFVPGRMPDALPEPPRPRELAPAVPCDLETICLKCLENDPAARYATAQDLADDLERFLRGDPITARPASLADRTMRFARRHWLAVGASVGVLLLLAVVAVTAILVAKVQEQELQRDVLRTNAYAAHAFAGAVAFRLREAVDAAVAIAADPSVVRALHDVDEEALEQRRIQSPFDSISFYDRSGVARAGAIPVPDNRRNLGKDYSWRDYFRGARRLGEAGLRAGYISRALLSETAGTWAFGISMPVYDEGGWIGVLLTTIGTDSVLGQQRLDRATVDGPMAVVVAPQDRFRDTTERMDDYVVILHNDLVHGAGLEMASPRLRELGGTRTDRDQLRWVDPEPITDDAHRDPVPGFEGRWLAGFAPVGDTGFVVIVQTRYDAAIAPNARLSRRLAWSVGVVTLAWAVVFGGGLWVYARRRRGYPRLLR